MNTAGTGRIRRAASFRGSAAALLVLLTGCSAPVADPGDDGAERPARALELPTLERGAENFAAGHPRSAGAAPGPVPDVPVRSAALEGAGAPRVGTPVRLSIPSLGLDLPIRPVGVQSDGSMEVPENPSVVGWYRFGPAPDSAAGATVLAAHVDSLEYGLGPFAKLETLQVGAWIAVVNDRGDEVVYRVDRIRRTGKAALADTGVFDRSGNPRLELITCGGTFDRQTRTYSDNVIVSAIPAG